MKKALSVQSAQGLARMSLVSSKTGHVGANQSGQR